MVRRRDYFAAVIGMWWAFFRFLRDEEGYWTLIPIWFSPSAFSPRALTLGVWASDPASPRRKLAPVEQADMQRPDEPRWEYLLLWRYGALLLVLVGLLAMGFGASGLCGTEISLALLPLGFVSLVAGVVLPRIEGTFTAGPSGVSGDVMPVHRLDQARYVVSGPALSADEPLPQPRDAGRDAVFPPPRITLGDVWDALDAAGLRPDQGALGTAYFSLDDGRDFGIPNRGFFDHGYASDELLDLMASLGVHPTASGRYPMPPDATPDMRQPRDPRYVERPDRPPRLAP